MGLKLKISVTKGRDLPRRLSMLDQRLRNRSRPMKQVKTYMIQRWTDNYEGKGSIYGSWAPLSNRSWRRGDDHGAAPLDPITGVTRPAFDGQNRAGVVTWGSVTWTIPGDNAAHGQHVGHNPYFSQPGRILWDTNGEDRNRVFEILSVFVRDQIGRL